MGLETGNYISDLVITNPIGTDDRSQGDDHLRLIKKVLKQTFPNINGAVTLTDEQINATAAEGALVPVGVIMMWSGTIATIPAGFKLCNGVGTISNGSAVPNLVSRFIIGSGTTSGGTYDVGDTGGSSNIVVSGSTAGHALTLSQIPAHSHTVPVNTNSSGGYAYVDGNDADGDDKGTISTSSVGSGNAHSHNVSITLTGGNLPPYYALAYIIKN